MEMFVIAGIVCVFVIATLDQFVLQPRPESAREREHVAHRSAAEEPTLLTA